MRFFRNKNLTFLMLIMLLFTGCQYADSIANDEIIGIVETLSHNENAQQTEQAQPHAIDGTLEMHVIDVGQGDSIFLSLPNNKKMLIDAGTSQSGSKVAKYIRNLGVTKIDYLILSHPHEDHVGGMATVIRSFEIDSVYMPDIDNTKDAYKQYLKAVEDKGLYLTYVEAGMVLFEENNLSAKFVAPAAESINDYVKNRDYNNMSAVIHLTFGNTSFLLTGDAGQASENDILSKKYNIKSDVLKVGHHGSATSTTKAFLDMVKPKYAVVSCGTGNSYGHPKAVTLTTLSNAGVEIFRTDESGTLIFTSDGSKVIPPDIKTIPIKPNAPPTEKPTSEATVKPSEQPKAEQEPQPQLANELFITKTGDSYHFGSCSSLGKSKIRVCIADAKEYFTACGRCNPPTEVTGNEPQHKHEVFITKTGKTYHVETCSSLSKSKIGVSLSDAKEYYEPCGRCNP